MHQYPLPLLHLLLFAGLLASSRSLAAAPADSTSAEHAHLRYQLLHLSPFPASMLHHEAPLQAADESLPWSHSAHDMFHGASLTLKLVHRDSPFSPLRLYPHPNPPALLKDRLGRDAARAEALSVRAQLAANNVQKSDLVAEPVTYSLREEAITGFTGPLVSGLKQGSGEYFIRVGVGTPPRQVYMVVDTGSDILWMQCAPCVDCYEQVGPIFNPAFSSSYRRIACSSPMCRMLELHGCASRSNVCIYQVAYGDGSFTEGEFSMEDVSFKGATMENIAMGCGHDNEGLFAGAAGLFGLGGGALSFPSQVGTQISRIFSYCLMDRDRDGASSLIFGQAGIPRGTMFTPLLRNPYLDTFYYVTLVGISVGGSMLTIPEEAFKMDVSGNGGVIVDSGTSVTRLVEVAYGPLRSAFREAMSGLPFAGGFSLFDTCYDLSGRGTVKVPLLSLHFEGGAEMVLPATNYVIPVDGQGTYCLAFASTAGGLSIIGNIQQQGFRVVFDAVASRLGFAANQC
ncbi:hypothetical protein GOP47_0027091 [Adiantum capillus-veneris]|nr:hypothetical protein GOP47_0027091 [Adiantum capillus-veneris]